MMPSITSTQAETLAQFVHAIRPSWDIPGIRTALYRARDRAPADELAVALVRLAGRQDLRTPAVLADDGPHWQGLAVAADRAPLRPKCARHGVAKRVTDGLCLLCHAEAKGGEPRDGPTLGLTEDQAATNARGARTVRRAAQAAKHPRVAPRDPDAEIGPQTGTHDPDGDHP